MYLMISILRIQDSFKSSAKYIVLITNWNIYQIQSAKNVTEKSLFYKYNM